jgi:hypothetical protein
MGRKGQLAPGEVGRGDRRLEFLGGAEGSDVDEAEVGLGAKAAVQRVET